MAKEQRTVRFTGTVQGVGFRFTACRVAAGFDITGYVRNCPDGSVECVAEGGRCEIDAFLVELEDRMRSYIRGRTQQTAPCSGQFRGFGTRY